MKSNLSLVIIMFVFSFCVLNFFTGMVVSKVFDDRNNCEKHQDKSDRPPNAPYTAASFKCLLIAG